MEFKYRLTLSMLISCLFCLLSSHSNANSSDLFRLKKAYPDQIRSIGNHRITWFDGSSMVVKKSVHHKSLQEKLNSPSLYDQLTQGLYIKGIPTNLAHYAPTRDPGRIRYEPFFLKMYGKNEESVEANLTVIYWMPGIFGNQYPLKVTSVNHVDQKLRQISRDLEKLVHQHPEYIPFLACPGGTFKWRQIAHTRRLSMHSFGMTIDINSTAADYWQWELSSKGIPFSETGVLKYKNSIPWAIIPIFEKYGFIWGGKWHHFDTMHFEYRPELFA